MKLARSTKPVLSTWSPFYPLSSVGDLFDAFSDGIGAAWRPSLDLTEDADKFHVEVEIPGIKREELDISLQEGVLRIAGEKKGEVKETSSHRRERYYGKFERLIALPSEVDVAKIQAVYQDGVLTLDIPKAEAVKPTKIEVKAS